MILIRFTHLKYVVYCFQTIFIRQLLIGYTPCSTYEIIHAIKGYTPCSTYESSFYTWAIRLTILILAGKVMLWWWWALTFVWMFWMYLLKLNKHLLQNLVFICTVERSINLHIIFEPDRSSLLFACGVDCLLSILTILQHGCRFSITQEASCIIYQRGN